MKFSHIGLALDVGMFGVAAALTIASANPYGPIPEPWRWLVLLIAVLWLFGQIKDWCVDGNRWADQAWDEPIPCRSWRTERELRRLVDTVKRSSESDDSQGGNR